MAIVRFMLERNIYRGEGWQKTGGGEREKNSAEDILLNSNDKVCSHFWIVLYFINVLSKMLYSGIRIVDTLFEVIFCSSTFDCLSCYAELCVIDNILLATS